MAWGFVAPPLGGSYRPTRTPPGDGWPSVTPALLSVMRRGEAAALRLDDLTIEATERWRKSGPAPAFRAWCQAGWWQSPAMVVRYTRSQAADRGAAGPLLPPFLTEQSTLPPPGSPNLCIERGRLPAGSLPLIGL